MPGLELSISWFSNASLIFQHLFFPSLYRPKFTWYSTCLHSYWILWIPHWIVESFCFSLLWIVNKYVFKNNFTNFRGVFLTLKQRKWSIYLFKNSITNFGGWFLTLKQGKKSIHTRLLMLRSLMVHTFVP